MMPTRPERLKLVREQVGGQFRLVAKNIVTRCGGKVMPRLTAFVMIAYLLIGMTFSASAFERRMGARPMGMGDAFLALAGETNSLNYNVAGLALLPDLYFSLEYANLYPGLDDGSIQENYIVYSQPLYPGGIGLAWNSRFVSGIYIENEFLLGYALQPVPDVPLSAGLTLKLFYLSYTDARSRAANAYFFEGTDAYQLGLDLGTLYEIMPETQDRPGIRAGLSLFNINQPNLGIRTAAQQPIEVRLGASANYGEFDGAIDLVYAEPHFQFHMGAEKWFSNGTWGVRAGMLAGGGTALTWTVGGSYGFDLSTMKARLNYAFNYSFGGIQETAGIHRVSLDFWYPLAQATKSPGRKFGIIQPKKKQSPEKVRQIKSYLFTKVDQCLRLIKKIDKAKTQGNPKQVALLMPAKQALHKAVGQLIMHRDILGFLKYLEEAVEKIKVIDFKTKK